MGLCTSCPSSLPSYDSNLFLFFKSAYNKPATDYNYKYWKSLTKCLRKYIPSCSTPVFYSARFWHNGESVSTVFTAEIWQSHILQRNLLQESRALTARVAGDNLASPQPVAQPCKPTVAVKGVGQQVPTTGTEKNNQIKLQNRNVRVRDRQKKTS